MATQRGVGGGWFPIALLAILGAVALFVLILFLASPFEDERPNAFEPAVAEPGLTITDIVRDAPELEGTMVDVRGEVERVVGPNSFTMSEQGQAQEEAVLVVDVDGEITPLNIGTGTFVQVIGTVRTFDLAQIEQEIGRDLDDNAFREFQGQPAIVARRVTLTPGGVPAGAPR